MERKDFIDRANALFIALIVFIHTGFSILNNIILLPCRCFLLLQSIHFRAGKEMTLKIWFLYLDLRLRRDNAYETIAVWRYGS